MTGFYGIRHEPLDGSRGKVVRARAHIDALAAELWSWRYLEKDPPYLLTRHFQESRSRFVFFVSDVTHWPAAWSLLIGDALNNLRSALDHAVWYLANLNPLPPGTDEKAIQFPFYASEQAFDGNVGRRLPNVEPEVVAYIKRLQPFPPAHPLQDALGFLIEQNNLDKHREIRPLVGMSIGETRFRPVNEINFVVSKVEFPIAEGFLAFKEGVEVAYVEGTTTGEGQPDVNLKVEGQVAPAFENGLPVLDGLQQMHDAVTVALREIEALL